MTQFEPEIAALLNHQDAFLRGKAAKVLLGLWRRRKYLPLVVRMLSTDREWEARFDAGGAISIFLRYPSETESQEPEERRRLLEALVSSLLRDDDASVQKNSYECFLECVAPERVASIPLLFDPERDVDWTLVEPYVQKA